MGILLQMVYMTMLSVIHQTFQELKNNTRPLKFRLERLFKRVTATKDICELRNMINVGYLITRQAIERKESRGLHYTVDYPKHAYDHKQQEQG